MNGSRGLVAGIIAILALVALPAIAAGDGLVGAASDHPGEEPSIDRSPSGIKTDTTTLPDRVTSAWDMPAFELKGLDGKTHRLDEWKGKVIVLNFWATWCGPCQYEIKDFEAYQEQYASRGLQIVGIGLDAERKLKNVARTLGINYPVLIADPVKNPGLLPQWGNPKQIVPYTVVIDRDGRLKYIHRGRMESEAFEAFVLPLLSADRTLFPSKGVRACSDSEQRAGNPDEPCRATAKSTNRPRGRVEQPVSINESRQPHCTSGML